MTLTIFVKLTVTNSFCFLPKQKRKSFELLQINVRHRLLGDHVKQSMWVLTTQILYFIVSSTTLDSSPSCHCLRNLTCTARTQTPLIPQKTTSNKFSLNCLYPVVFLPEHQIHKLHMVLFSLRENGSDWYCPFSRHSVKFYGSLIRINIEVLSQVLAEFSHWTLACTFTKAAYRHKKTKEKDLY